LLYKLKALEEGVIMGFEARREREKQELRKAILEAALDTAQEEGWQKVTIRKIAEQIDYSPPTIYELFDNKDAVLVALKLEAHSKKLEYVEKSLAHSEATGANPTQTIIDLVMAYCTFARQNPHLYSLIHGLGVHCNYNASIEAEQKIFMLSKRTFQNLLPTLTEVELIAAVEIVVSVLDGFIIRSINSEAGITEADLTLINITLNSLLDAWTGNPTLLKI
jgi:AcrR family transcriptional regulator